MRTQTCKNPRAEACLASSKRHYSQVVKSGELQRVPTGIYTTLV